MSEVTDKMVEAAVGACNLHSKWQKTEYDFMRIAIEAALAAREPIDAGEHKPDDATMSDANTLIWLGHDDSGKFSEGDKALLLRCASRLLGVKP